MRSIPRITKDRSVRIDQTPTASNPFRVWRRSVYFKPYSTVTATDDELKSAYGEGAELSQPDFTDLFDIEKMLWSVSHWLRPWLQLRG